ncbi:MAG TPA: Clp protease N-terminal domain-containing protein [Hyphomicrobium sp.]|nr:Clp protease N-terminal domain-containing protein [Hyphomicrobium sp.]
MTAMIVDELARIPMSPFLTATLTRAADYATAQTHREVTLEHLLLALTEDPEATVVLKASNVDLHRLTAEVSDHLGRYDDRIDPSSGQPIAISADLRRILEAAAAAARQGRRREINGAIVLAAIVGDGKSPAAHMLRVQGLTFEEAIRALQHVTAAPPPPQPQLQPPPPQQRPPEVTQPAPVVYPPPHDERTGPPLEPPHDERTSPPMHPPPYGERTSPPTQSPPPFGERTGPPTQPPAPEPARPATTEEILAAARERLEARKPPGQTTGDVAEPVPSAPTPLPRANYPDRGTPPPRPAPAPATADTVFQPEPAHRERSHASPLGEAPPYADDHRFEEVRNETHGGIPPAGGGVSPSWDEGHPAARSAPVPPPAPAPAAPQRERRRGAASGPFVGSWPLIEAGQLIENIPRRMRVGIPVVAEARIARADVKALAEGLAGGGAAFRHEIVVTKAMSVRLRSPGGGFTIENRSPETQWIENVLGLGNDDYASWRWTVTPMARGRRQLQLIVSARTVGADGMTAETALPDQFVDVKVAINYSRTALKWAGWLAAAVVGGLLAKFGETGWIVLQIMFARHFGG